MKNFTNITDIIPIVTAKVPILKMRHVRTNRECDLSISNRFGQRNTYLLKIYSEIDSRARVSFLWILLWIFNSIFQINFNIKYINLDIGIFNEKTR